jgi:hypothetical protein
MIRNSCCEETAFQGRYPNRSNRKMPLALGDRS